MRASAQHTPRDPAEPSRQPANELGDFLRTRRAALTPAEVGLTTWGTRRVPGLRREELAQLAGISINYYIRLEQGQSANAGDSIIEALARALRLAEDERAHLYALARPAAARRARSARPETPSPGAVRLLESMRDVPAVLLGRRNDFLAWNPLGHALIASHLDPDSPADPARRPNQMRLLFLDPHTRELYRRWSDEAALAVSSLRYTAADYPDDRLLAELIGDLSIRSPEFATLWARHDVRLCSRGTKLLHHPEIGDLELHYEAMQLPDTHGQRLFTYTAEAGSPSEDALTLLRRRP
ncbi:helix-turn-helix transcriptional regulator [Nocardia sp. alder85J]|uniref:helix-turn-helix transcriptional regulator n=1 Tax=Nocardia sp. alder85J TaxID=2862949 RepID=UPI001CD418B1|nr:helix-turn-helix transcriptional regulator [Nocardia sp. alder85J]MCX4095897.1 helix-turn-helix transcriptional regulator [Nocardia sp. alder85J]